MPDEHARNGKQHSTHKCPICGERVAADTDTFPFCSKRCRKLDLGKWLDGSYTISRPIDQGDLDEGE